jgi:hemerythrin-like domain-containing protein
MNAYIQELRADHQRLSRLLHYLSDNLPGERRPLEPEMMQPVRKSIEYYREYSVVVHHGKEEALFRILVERDRSSQVYVDVLTAEHRLLVHTSNELYAIALGVERRKMSDRAMLAKIMQRFITTKIRHMRFEEDTVFPLLESRLTMDDWKRVIGELPVDSDPLFDRGAGEGYLGLLELLESHAGQAAEGRR